MILSYVQRAVFQIVVDAELLYTSAKHLLQQLQESDIVPALRCSLDDVKPNHRVSQAAGRLMDSASVFSDAERDVATSAGIQALESPSYWFDLETGTPAERKTKLLSCLKMIARGQSFLARLSSLVENQADPLDLDDGSGDIKMRLVDATDRASDPDRISRLIDGVDLIYRACARLAQIELNTLRVMRIGGVRGRTVVFNGDAEAATAARRIIRAANDIASNSIQGERYSADEVADSNPFMQSLDDLYRVGALNADDAEDIRTGVLTGTIMVLECGARLYGVDATGDPLQLQTETIGAPDSVVAETTDELEYLNLDGSKSLPDDVK